MKYVIELYHGSQFIIDEPKYGAGKKYNDYGIGFYCTKDIELAKEWAVTKESDGYANIYELDLNGLKVLNLNDYNILYWITILITNRQFSIKTDIAKAGVEYLKQNFTIDLSSYDVIIGYRADDSYFTFAQYFLNNTISIRRLSEVLKFGNLGQQVVLVSEKAFTHIKYKGNVVSSKDIYYPLREDRNIQARIKFLSNKSGKVLKDDIYLFNLMKGDVEKNDPRL